MLREWSLWTTGAVCFGLLIAARELGGLLRGWHDRRLAQEDSELEEFSMSSVIGLLALLIGFTFSLALQRYELRRDLVIQEANALGTTWLRLALLDADDQARLRPLMRSYVDARVAFGVARTAEQSATANLRTNALQQRLWQDAGTAVAPARSTVLAALVLAPLNESIDLAGARKAQHEASVPTRLLRVLLGYALVSAGMIGYQRRRFRTASTVVLLLFTLAGTVILDLDRPTTGGILEPQTPMLDLQRSIASPALTHSPPLALSRTCDATRSPCPTVRRPPRSPQ